MSLEDSKTVKQIELFEQPDVVEVINYSDMSIQKSILWMTTITDNLKPASKLYINYYIGLESQKNETIQNKRFHHMSTSMREIAQAINFNTNKSGSLRAIVELLLI